MCNSFDYGARQKRKICQCHLGHDSIEHVINSPEPFLSTTIGRYGNRIANGKFTLYGEEHQLTVNNGPNSLHGGPTGFHARVWDAVQPNESTVIFNYTSADGEEGFPGTLEIEMTYRLEDEANALVIEYRATTDKATVVNLTNHGFFNLAGISNPSPTVLNNILTINADFYVPIDEVSIPTGEILKVENTPMDFRTPHAIGERIDDKFQQLVNGAGYDHCYVLNKAESGELSLAATCTEPVSGRTMEVYTTETACNFIRETGWEDSPVLTGQHSPQEALYALKHNASPILPIRHISHRQYCSPEMNISR